MRETALNKPFDRRAVIGFVVSMVPSAAALGGDTGARMSVREIVTTLKNAEQGRPPDLSRRDLSGLNLADLDFKGADLSHSNLFGADLTASSLEGANLS